MKYLFLLTIMFFTCCSPKMFPKYSKPQETKNTKITTVLYLDFRGGHMENSFWQEGLPFTLKPSRQSKEHQEEIRRIVAEDYSIFNVDVTTDSTLYYGTPVGYRARMVITQSFPFNLQMIGGIALFQSYSWKDDTPAFIFEQMISNNTYGIAEAVTHEAGHMFGLRHQSDYKGCNLISEYDYGQGESKALNSYAPIMGIGYDKTWTLWATGPTPVGCISVQNDVEVLSTTLGKKDDQVGDKPRQAKLLKLNDEYHGIINSGTDQDWFAVDVDARKPVLFQVFPENVAGHGMNLAFSIEVYDSKGKLQFDNKKDDLPWFFEFKYLETDRYYIKIQSRATKFATKDQHLGTYHLLTK